MNAKEAEVYWNENLSEALRKEISELYDDKSVKLDVIVDKYKLPFGTSKLTALILPRQTDIKCKWCGDFLFIKRRRATGKYITNPEYCLNCGHINVTNCMCQNCVETRARQEEQKRAAEERRKTEKKRNIIKEYGEKTAPIDFDSLSLIERIKIGIILSHTAGKTEFALNDYDDKMYPAEEDIGFLIQMLQRSILIISDDFDPDVFSEDLKSCKFEMLRVKINVELDSERIEGLMNGKIKLSRRGFRALWMYMASLQLTEYLTNIMAKYHFKFSPGKTTKAMINDMLEHFSVSESMRLIYIAIMKACTRYQEGGITRNHAANMVITICKNYTTRAVKEGWTVKRFERDYDIEISTAESYIYTNILRIGEDGFRCSPGMMSDKLYDKLFLKEKTDDTQPE